MSCPLLRHSLPPQRDSGRPPRRTVLAVTARLRSWFWPPDAVVLAPVAVERPACEKRPARARFTPTRSCGSSGAIALGGEAYKDAVPYVLAYVELTEGPTMLTNIVAIDPTVSPSVSRSAWSSPYRGPQDQRYPGSAGVTVE